ncbi:MAG: hypothetical protein J6A94_05065 [Lachnospiraceae bacterium]|nr:hypothetical protein [Lachnospiraceae bacterium]
MIKTLRLSFALKNTYRVNSILYSIKQIPLLKRIIPEGVYHIRGFKLFANVLSVIWEILTVFLGKLLYFLLMIVGAASLYSLPAESQGQVFLHLLLVLTLIGAVMNTYMFNPTKDKYYAMILLGMNAREYALTNYFYAIGKVLVGFLLCSFLFGKGAGLTWWQCLLIPFFVAGAKLMVAAAELRDYEKNGNVGNENKLNKLIWWIIAVFLAVAYGLPALGILLPVKVSVTAMCFFVAGGLISVKKVIAFRDYRAMYQELLAGSMMQMDPSAQAKLQREASNKLISADTDIASSKKGFEYLNELFIKRHQKILWKSTKKITYVSMAVIAAVLLGFVLMPELKEGVNGVLLLYLPYFVFVMYMINRGTGFTRALFVNCDHSLLTYPFYKQPKFILKLFKIRLREIIKVNLLPASVIGAGLSLLLYASGGTDNPWNYIVLFVSIAALSVFFSVHYLTIYYLLQPYNAGTEIKSGTYQLIMWLTYMVCYMMIRIKMSTVVFGIMTIVFCLLYSVIACALVYKFAPRTFKIRT